MRTMTLEEKKKAHVRHLDRALQRIRSIADEKTGEFTYNHDFFRWNGQPEDESISESDMEFFKDVGYVQDRPGLARYRVRPNVEVTLSLVEWRNRLHREAKVLVRHALRNGTELDAHELIAEREDLRRRLSEVTLAYEDLRRILQEAIAD